ncbi:MAG: hypothetical protein JWM58_3983 [Rhizobium sp.]|nr:hypothetical protein [Rhizobium sp.]
MTDQIYIGLLRGINVGGKVLKMADLKQTVADLGFGEVRTYLQSGNLVFRAPKAGDDTLAARISKAIEDKARMDVHVLVRSAAEWDDVIGNNPFPEAAALPKTLHAFALDGQPEKARVEDLQARDHGSEEWKIVGDALYLHTPAGFGKSRLGNSIERLLKVSMTGRNWNTVLALRELAAAL